MLLQFIKIVIYVNKLVDICINRYESPKLRKNIVICEQSKRIRGRSKNEK